MYDADAEIDQTTFLRCMCVEHATVINCCFVTRHGKTKLKPKVVTT